MKHTKGPWEALSADRSSWNECKAKEMAGCIYSAGSVVAYLPQHMANAQLIASAPDLLEALESITRDYRILLAAHLKATGESAFGWGTLPADIAEKAIAKAKGGA